MGEAALAMVPSRFLWKRTLLRRGLTAAVFFLAGPKGLLGFFALGDVLDHRLELQRVAFLLKEAPHCRDE